MSMWGISNNASRKEKLKSEMADELGGYNSCGIIDYDTYSELFDFSMNLLNEMYDLGRRDANNERD